MKTKTLLFLLIFFISKLSFSLNAQINRIWLTHSSEDPEHIVINWYSNSPGDSKVYFRAGEGEEQMISKKENSVLHHVEIPLQEKDVLYHYHVSSGNEHSKEFTFKGYPSAGKELRVAVLGNWAFSGKPDLRALRRDDPHLLISLGDNIPDLHSLCGDGVKDCIEPFLELIDSEPELFKTIPFMPILGNHDKQIRDRGEKYPPKDVYDVEATAYRKFFELPGDEWKWKFSIPAFDVTFVALDLNHISDFGTTWQTCHDFQTGSEQLNWYRDIMNGKNSEFMVTLQNERNKSTRAQAGGEWGRLFQKGTAVLSGYGYFSEIAEVEGAHYYNTSLRAGDIYPDDNPLFLEDKGSYLLLNFDNGMMKILMKSLEGKILNVNQWPEQSSAKNCSENKTVIKPSLINPRYWQYKEETVLLLGGSNNDNLFQSDDVKEQMDLLQQIGGNYIRNTMSDRGEDDEHAFYLNENGMYDLTRWNDEYWNRFENLLKLSEERDIIVQIEIWDRFDFWSEPWQRSPFNPGNNINYSYKQSGLDEEYTTHPAFDKQPFFHIVEGMPLYSSKLDVVRKYQENFVDKLLSHSLKYGNVLYCINNETSTPPEWGRYWVDFISERAEERGKEIYITDMFDRFHRPQSCEPCLNALADAEEYTFLDISQINSRHFNQAHWDTLSWIMEKREYYPLRPVNCVKVYGGGEHSFGSGTNEDGVERFCRDVIGGCAAVRHHRPTSGNGLNEKSVATIKALRKAETKIRLWEISPNQKLLSEREEDEAYISAEEGKKYLLLFPDQGSIKLDLENYSGKFKGKWISIQSGEWGEEFTVEGGRRVEINTPGEGGWWAVISR